MKGTFYGVSVGPGDAELITLKSVRLLNSCPVIAAPQSGGKTTALDIAAKAVDLSGKTVITLPFLMTRDKQKLDENYHRLAELLKAPLDGGQNVAMLSLGDASLYSSFSYIARLLAAEGYNVEVSAGVTSFCASAAALCESLTDMNRPLHIIPGATGDDDALNLPGTKVFMKSGKGLPRLLALIKERGLLGKSMAVQNCGMPEENIFKTIPDDLSVSPDYYFTTVIVKG